MKAAFIVILSLLCYTGYGNMASPVISGSRPANVCTSRDVDVLNETIGVTIDSAFRIAVFDVTYDIDTRLDGRQVPLLFYASHYHDSFIVWVDGQQTPLMPIPDGVDHFASSPFVGFSYLADSSYSSDNADEVKMNWGIGNIVCRPHDFQYFETVLAKGRHTIRVKYYADAWKDKSGWADEFSFNYSLSPARHWRSFGSLKITLNVSAFRHPFTTSLGAPSSGSLSGIAEWDLNALPSADYFVITYTPALPHSAELLIKWESAIIWGLWSVYLLLPLLFLWQFRKNETPEKYPTAFAVVCILLPVIFLVIDLLIVDIRLFLFALLLVLLACISLFDRTTRGFRTHALPKKIVFTLLSGSLIMSILGVATPLIIRAYIRYLIGNGHGDYMYFMIFIFLPVVFGCYLAVMLFADFLMRRHTAKKA